MKSPPSDARWSPMSSSGFGSHATNQPDGDIGLHLPGTCARPTERYRPAMSKERYIAAKQKWAEKQKASGVTARAVASQDRLPPGQKLTDGFPVLDLGIKPEIGPTTWQLKLDGLVEHPVDLT